MKRYARVLALAALAGCEATPLAIPLPTNSDGTCADAPPEENGCGDHGTCLFGVLFAADRTEAGIVPGWGILMSLTPTDEGSALKLIDAQPSLPDLDQALSAPEDAAYLISIRMLLANVLEVGTGTQALPLADPARLRIAFGGDEAACGDPARGQVRLTSNGSCCAFPRASVGRTALDTSACEPLRDGAEAYRRALRLCLP